MALQARRAAPGAAAVSATQPGRWLMLAVLLLGQFMCIIDVLVTNVAMPSIAADLHASGASLQLVVGGYTVAYAMLLVTGARLGDRYGRRRLYLAGVLVFTVASLACALAPDSQALIAFRLVQGAGAAILVPQVFSIIQLTFTGQARARALSAYAAVLSAGAVAGHHPHRDSGIPGPPGDMKPGFECVRTRWKPGFIASAAADVPGEGPRL